MKRQLKIMSILILSILLFGVKITSAHADNVTIRVAGDNNYPPYEYMSENGVFEGFNVDIMNAISRRQDLTWRSYQWTGKTP